MKKSIALKDDLSLDKKKDSVEGILIRLTAAIMEHRYDSLNEIYLNLLTKQDSGNKNIIHLCVLGMMHVINAESITKATIVFENGKRFKLHQNDITNNKELKKADKKYLPLSFEEVIDTFIGHSLGFRLKTEEGDLLKKLLSLVDTGGMGRSYRFNLDSNLPTMMQVIKKVEEYLMLLNELPVKNPNKRIIDLAYSFLDQGKFQVLVEERFFQPSAPSVSTTVMWHNYVFLRDNLFGLNPHLLDESLIDACNRRNMVWNYIQRYMIGMRLEGGKWYLADIRKRFPKEKLIACAGILDDLLKTKPKSSLEDISKCIEACLAKKK